MENGLLEVYLLDIKALFLIVGILHKVFIKCGTIAALEYSNSHQFLPNLLKNMVVDTLPIF